LRRHLIGPDAFESTRLGKDKSGFEIGEPSRHDEIVGRQLQPAAACRLHERKILIGELKNRNLRDVHLLIARKSEKQIERPFEAVELDNQHVFGGDRRALGCIDFGDIVFGHAAAPVISAKRASALSMSRPAGLRS